MLEWIRGHYFNALTILVGVGKACFALPLVLRLDDGIKSKATEKGEGKGKKKVKTSLVTKMADLCVTYAEAGSYVILDAYFACEPVLKSFRQNALHLITRVRCSTVAYAPFCSVPTLTGRGRPRIWGSSIKLASLFALVADFPTAKVWLYGQQVTVSYQCFEFHWDSPHQLVKFVLTQLPNGRRLILLSTDLCLTGPEIIAAYGLRFKIEVTFRQLVHLLAAILSFRHSKPFRDLKNILKGFLGQS